MAGMDQNEPSPSVKMAMDNADWSDHNTRVVCEIFAAQVQDGNRPSTHLNNKGYKEVIENFSARTGLVYTKRQFKNKWDRLRGEYNTWKKLNAQTGLGWDEAKKTVVATAERWAALKKVSFQFIHFCPALGRHNFHWFNVMFFRIYQVVASI